MAPKLLICGELVGRLQMPFSLGPGARDREVSVSPVALTVPKHLVGTCLNHQQMSLPSEVQNRLFHSQKRAPRQRAAWSQWETHPFIEDTSRTSSVPELVCLCVCS